jgi:hypothetical protein
MLVAIGISNGGVALAVPVIPFIASRGTLGFILRIISALHHDPFVVLDHSAPLRRGNLRLAVLPHRNFSLGRRIHLNSISALAQGSHCHVWGIDFNLRFAALENCVGHGALRDLQLNARSRQVGNLSLAALVEPHDVGIVELHFGPGAGSSRYSVATDERRVHRARNPIAGITALG